MLEENGANPRDIKRRLARRIVAMYHGEKAALEAEAHFDQIHIKKEAPDEMPEFKLPENARRIIDVMVAVNFASSKGEARRLIRQKAVSIDGEQVFDEFFEITLDKPAILKVGKRKFVKLLPG